MAKINQTLYINLIMFLIYFEEYLTIYEFFIGSYNFLHTGNIYICGETIAIKENKDEYHT